MHEPSFNIRVYGLLITDGAVLVAEQMYKGHHLLKFPGGGLVHGEGLADGLKREFMEELNVQIDIICHYYTTDFYVRSMFNENNQVISIFYLVRLREGQSLSLRNQKDGIMESSEELFYFIPLAKLPEAGFKLPIEKLITEMLYRDFSAGACRSGPV
jgi:8-oxo-dGTP diphosphatase